MRDANHNDYMNIDTAYEDGGLSGFSEGHIAIEPPENFSFPVISEGETKTNHTGGKKKKTRRKRKTKRKRRKKRRTKRKKKRKRKKGNP